MGNDADTFSTLLTLQGQIKRDHEGYRDEFIMQYRHYQAARAIFTLNPSTESKEFSDLVMFIAQVCNLYPSDTSEFPSEVMELLGTHGTVLHHTLRKHLVQALLLLRNRNVITADALLPLCFRLFRCSDKALRHLLFTHIVQDIRRANQKHRDDKFNRSIQNFLYQMVQDENEVAAKKSLAVLIELYRRQVWTDAKSVNVICSACFHGSTRIMVAALKFFLGTDLNNDNDDSDAESDDESKRNNPVALDREAVYKAFNKGTRSSKKKKQAKLKRVMHGLKKQQRSISTGGLSGQATFSALQLVNDPQGFVEKLFTKLRSCNEKFEVKLMMMNLISRVVGTHKLLLLNFYPFLQRYIQPHQRDVTHLLATAVQACHDQVPPDVVEPLMRQLVNQFVHDRARPEVIAVGLNTVREICMRMPLLMSEELLKDLALYKKAREKAVVSAARSIIALFRELAPSMLDKKDRGKDADLSLAPKKYGELSAVLDTIPGIELLGEASEDEDEDEDEDEEEEGEEGGEVEEESVSGEESEENEGADEGLDADEAGSLDEESLDSDPEDEENESGGESTEEESLAGSGDEEEPGILEEEGGIGAVGCQKVVSLEGQSLRAMKKMAAVQTAEAGNENQLLAETGGFLSNEDFQHIRRVQAKRNAESALTKHGLKRAKNNKSGVSPAKVASVHDLGERRVDPANLQASIKRRREKEERMASVMAGREGREFSAKTALKQKKSGGLTNREQQRRKTMPLGVHREKMKSRMNSKKRGGKSRSNQFRGKKAWKS